jgi:hypothetical protein
MPEVGEELVGAWLRYVAECDFVQYNVPLRQKQGEADVIGINLSKETAYICEVTTHLVDGILYVKNGQPNNVAKLTQKFENDAEYAAKYLHDFDRRFMFWSPIVKYPTSEKTKHNQFQDLIDVRRNLRKSHQIDIDMIVNEIYLEHVEELREKAACETSDSEYPVFRLFQILSRSGKHVAKLEASGVNSTRLLLGNEQE